MKTIKERFIEKIKKDPITGCWEWTACKDSRGYGQFKTNGKPARAHRVSYELFVGSIPEDLFVCHKCDNPSCVNPDHLFAGTPKDNMDDMNNKGRSRGPIKLGSIPHNRKLSDKNAISLKYDIIHTTMTDIQLGIKYGVHRGTVYQIRVGKCYVNVT